MSMVSRRHRGLVPKRPGGNAGGAGTDAESCRPAAHRCTGIATGHCAILVRQRRQTVGANHLRVLGAGEFGLSLSDAYQAARNRTSGYQQQQLIRDQRSWLQDRDGCGSDGGCIERAYRDRLSELSGG